MAGSAEISQLSKAVDNAKAVMEKLSRSLSTIADEFDEKQRKLDIAKVSLSSTGVVGGVMTVVGLALAPVTFGASLGLTIAGGIVAGGSAIGNVSAVVADKVISKKSLENAQNLLNVSATRTAEIQCQLRKLIETLNANDRLLAQIKIENCPFLTKEMKEMLIIMLKERQSIRVTSQLTDVGEAVEHMISAVQILAKARKAGNALNGMTTEGNTAVGTASAASVASVGRSIGLAADLDLGALVYYSHNIHKNEPSKLAKKIRDVAECLK